MKNKKKFLLFLLGIVTIMPSHAQPSESEYGKIVINLAGKQRMLTQKMSKEALLIIKGIKVEKNRKTLQETITIFDKTLHGLRDGDHQLHLPKTKEPKIIEEIDKELKLWNLFKSFLEKIVHGEENKKSLKAVEIANMPLLKIMNNIVGLYEKKYTSNLSPMVTKTINLAGRERMLIQKMTKELLLIANNSESDIYLKSLQTDGKVFQEKLAELMGESSHIENPLLAKEIKELKSLWSLYQDKIANTELSPAAIKVFKQSEKESIERMSLKLINVAQLIDDERYQINLSETERLFDTTLNGLIKGDEKLGIKATSNALIQEQLKKVQLLWSEYQPIIKSVDTSKEALKKAMEINMPLLKEMDNSVKLYELHLK